MWKQLFDKFRTMDNKIKQMTTKGYYFSLLVSMFSALILFTYIHFYSSPDLYYIGITLFKTSLTFAIEFFICGFAFDHIKKERIKK